MTTRRGWNPLEQVYELMPFEPIVVLWKSRGARIAWFSYIVLPRADGVSEDK